MQHPPLPGAFRLPGSAASDTTSAAIACLTTWATKRQRLKSAEFADIAIDRRSVSEGRGFSLGGDQKGGDRGGAVVLPYIGPESLDSSSLGSLVVFDQSQLSSPSDLVCHPSSRAWLKADTSKTRDPYEPVQALKVSLLLPTLTLLLVSRVVPATPRDHTPYFIGLLSTHSPSCKLRAWVWISGVSPVPFHFRAMVDKFTQRKLQLCQRQGT